MCSREAAVRQEEQQQHPDHRGNGVGDDVFLDQRCVFEGRAVASADLDGRHVAECHTVALSHRLAHLRDACLEVGDQRPVEVYVLRGPLGFGEDQDHAVVAGKVVAARVVHLERRGRLVDPGKQEWQESQWIAQRELFRHHTLGRVERGPNVGRPRLESAVAQALLQRDEPLRVEEEHRMTQHRLRELDRVLDVGLDAPEIRTGLQLRLERVNEREAALEIVLAGDRNRHEHRVE